MPEGGLDPAALVELKPGNHGDWPAVLAFAICLAVRRRCVGQSPGNAADTAVLRPVLWCATPAAVTEHGRLYGRGLSALGLVPDALILAEAPREIDALWVLEEGLRSGCLSLAAAPLKEVGLTPARRLALAAAAGGAACVLLTLPGGAPTLAASLRLRVRRRASAVHPLEPRAPGGRSFQVAIERCRGVPTAVETSPFDLEWCDVTYRFRLVSGLAHGASRSAEAGQRASV
ncbi:MAG: hypothetical protein AB7F78_07795 [Hyphomicrobiaceae bacterium]